MTFTTSVPWARDLKDKLEKRHGCHPHALSQSHPNIRWAARSMRSLVFCWRWVFLIVFLSSSLIANTLSALLTQHLRHIGVIKLVGGRRQQVFGMYLRSSWLCRAGIADRGPAGRTRGVWVGALYCQRIEFQYSWLSHCANGVHCSDRGWACCSACGGAFAGHQRVAHHCAARAERGSGWG
jgi:hypothetical protein